MAKRLIRGLEWAFILAMAVNFLLQVNRYYFKGKGTRELARVFAGEIRPTAGLTARGESYPWPPLPERDASRPVSLKAICEGYPRSCGGREVIYDFLDTGNLETARKCMNGWFYVERFQPVRLGFPPAWEEDPYQERYWRFIFYGLRPTRDLLHAFRATSDPLYARKLLTLVESFIDTGMAKPNAWNDCHAAAFRTMVLVNTWWKLREKGVLPPASAEKILGALVRHGEFLMDPSHFDHGHNHGITQSGALLALATSFPDLPDAPRWAETARRRVAQCMLEMVDADGFLVENSAYYHFYALEKFWEIRSYAGRFGIDFAPVFEAKLRQMIRFATYLLQPDQSIPLLGASLPRTLRPRGIYRDIADNDPNLRYVLTKGTEGTAPESASRVFPNTGLTILRSGWGRGGDFTEQTQVVFDYGPYRTSHSDLDGLNFTLFGGGGELLSDSGLYSYEKDPVREYFHGTAAHNTVLVDGMDQLEGSPAAGTFREGDGYAYQAAQHALYPGVEHARAVALLGKNLVLVVDRLKSDRPRQYELLFHLAPDLDARTNGLDVTGTGPRPGQRLGVVPLVRENVNLAVYRGNQSPFRGYQSDMYERLVPRTTLAYSQKAAEAVFVTLLEIGPHDPGLRASFSPDLGVVSVSSRGKDIQVGVQVLDGSPGSVTVGDHDPVTVTGSTVDAFRTPGEWFTGNGAGAPPVEGQLTAEGLRLALPRNGRDLELTRKLKLNLADRNLFLKFRIEHADAVENGEIQLSTDQWKGRMSLTLKNAFRHLEDTGWMTVGLGKGRHRRNGGYWKETGRGFDWSRIDAVRFRFRARAGSDVTLRLGRLSTVPQQREGVVSLVFDDGHWSVEKGAEILARHGLKGSVAVIAERPRANIRGYLNLAQLRKLKDVYGWDVVNHSEHHRHALKDYLDKGDAHGYEKDVLNGARFLQENGLDTAPNWYVYPFGAIDRRVQDMVGRYYKFARSVRTQPEVFPFGDPLAVKVFCVRADMTPEEIMDAVEDAREFRLTLLLVFHRLGAASRDYNEYLVSRFEDFAAKLAASKARVRTLGEIDRDNGVPPTRLSIVDAKPIQLRLDIRSN